MLENAIIQFSENLNAMREFTEVIEPTLTNRIREDIAQNEIHFAPLAVALDSMGIEDFKLTPEVRKSFEDQIDGHVNLTINEASGDNTGGITVSFAGKGVKDTILAVLRFKRTTYHIEILYRSTLIGLVSAVEWFLSQLLHSHFENYPEAAGITDKTVSFRELQAMDSLDDARRYLVDRHVEEILRGSFEDWIDFLRNSLKLKMGYLNEDYGRLVEIYQRRNLLVHNGGYVNRIYENKVEKEYLVNTSSDVPISVSQGYVDEATDTFERSFILIAAELWKKQDPSDMNRSTILNSLAFEHLKAERWRIAEGFSRFVMQDKGLPEHDQLIGSINYWQSVKWQNRFAEVQGDIAKADFSAKKESFRLAQLALLDDEPAFFDLLPSVLSAGIITKENIQLWPLFRQIRNTKTYKERYP